MNTSDCASYVASRFSCFVTCNLSLELTVAFAANETPYSDVLVMEVKHRAFFVSLKG